jgi:hypothetical protein
MGYQQLMGNVLNQMLGLHATQNKHVQLITEFMKMILFGESMGGGLRNGA